MTPSDGLAAFICEALLTDGGHHKQWYLQQLLETLVGTDGAQQLREGFQKQGYTWEDGIAP